LIGQAIVVALVSELEYAGLRALTSAPSAAIHPL
jgi:hypothetical protein